MTTTDYIINNQAAVSRAKSAETRKVLVALVKEKTGWTARKGVTMTELRYILNS